MEIAKSIQLTTDPLDALLKNGESIDFRLDQAAWQQLKVGDHIEFWEDFSGYKPVRGVAALLFLLFASFAATAKTHPSNSVNLNWQQSEQLIEEATGRRFKSFSDFVFALYDTEENLFTPEQLSLMSRFVLGEHIDGTDRELLFRLLGLYAQLKYGGEALRVLEQLVVIPTFAKEGQPQHASEHVIQIARKLRVYPKDLGLISKT